MIWLDFIFRALFGIFILVACSGLIGLIDIIFEKMGKEIPPLVFNLAVWGLVLMGGWALCYGIGDFFIEVFFR